MRKFKILASIGLLLGCAVIGRAQETFPENGVADPRHGHYAFINATIVKDASTTLNNATSCHQRRKNSGDWRQSQNTRRRR
jgi:hypothetical protein